MDIYDLFGVFFHNAVDFIFEYYILIGKKYLYFKF